MVLLLACWTFEWKIGSLNLVSAIVFSLRQETLLHIVSLHPGL